MSIDYPVDNFVVFNNNGRGQITHDVDGIKNLCNPNVKKIHVTHMPANVGCSGAWNLIIKCFMKAPYWVISNHDVMYEPGFLEEALTENQNLYVVGGAEIYKAFFKHPILKPHYCFECKVANKQAAKEIKAAEKCKKDITAIDKDTQEIIRKERAFEYAGDTVDVIPHLTDEIIRRIKLAGKVNKANIVIVEFGGTVGEYKNGIFFEATRIFKLKHPNDLIHIHVTYLPFLSHIGELKTKPAQTSVHILNSLGIQPDIMITRSDFPVDQKRLDKLALFCNMHADKVFTSPNLDSIYRVPLTFHKQKSHLASTCLNLLKIKSKKHKNIDEWKEMVGHLVKKNSKIIKVAIIGKYFATGKYQLGDSYVSVIEALKHASAKFDLNIDIAWIDSEKFNKNPSDLSKFDGIIVPQGWGKRGTEGKIKTIKYVRENNIPFLGLCFGMQMATIEFARNVLNLKDANSTEVNEKTKNPVIHIMDKREKFLKEKQI